MIVIIGRRAAIRCSAGATRAVCRNHVGQLAILDAWFMHAIALRGAQTWTSTSAAALAPVSAYLSMAMWVVVLVAGPLIAFASTV